MEINVLVTIFPPMPPANTLGRWVTRNALVSIGLNLEIHTIKSHCLIVMFLSNSSPRGQLTKRNIKHANKISIIK